MKHWSNIYSPLVTLVLFTSIVDSQTKVTSALIKQDTSIIVQSQNDSLNLKAAAIVPVRDEHAKSGTLAMLLSAVLPGAGQVYAHRYYTIPVFWGFGIFFRSRWLKADDVYRKYQALFTQSIQLDTNHIGNFNYQNSRDIWHDYRDEFTIYLALTYILNIVDAYVSATLYSFDVSDNLGGSASIRFRIPLH